MAKTGINEVKFREEIRGNFRPLSGERKGFWKEKGRRQTSKMVKVRKFLCKIGIHKWSRKTYIDYGPTSNVKTWKRYCKICGKRQSWVQAKGDKKGFRRK
ncbi:MAG: hypothetical protein KAU16_04225 [Methanophagales archaeon]|nr:hypothetical protein [Methanophagales archaeon]